jgi:hypothetical protein
MVTVLRNHANTGMLCDLSTAILSVAPMLTEYRKHGTRRVSSLFARMPQCPPFPSCSTCPTAIM